MNYHIRIIQEKLIDHGEYQNIEQKMFRTVLTLESSDKLPEILSHYIKDIDSLLSVEIKIYKEAEQ